MLVALAVAGCSTAATDTRAEVAGLPSTHQDLKAHEWALAPRGGELPAAGQGGITLDVGEDEVSGRGPCAIYRGDLEVDDDTVTVTDIVTSERPCRERSPLADEAFDAYLALLAAGVTVEADDHRLTLFGDDLLVAFMAYDSEEVVLGRWRVVRLPQGPEGARLEPIEGPEPVVVFETGGGLWLDTGCRQLTGDWERDGEGIDAAVDDATAEPCVGTPGLVAQDAAVVEAIDRATRLEVAPGALTALDENGDVVLGAVTGDHDDDGRDDDDDRPGDDDRGDDDRGDDDRGDDDRGDDDRGDDGRDDDDDRPGDDDRDGGGRDDDGRDDDHDPRRQTDE